MSIFQILMKLIFAYIAYDQAVKSENGFVIALSIGYLVFGGLGFLLMGVFGADPKWINIAVGVVMLIMAIACRWHHWAPYKRW